MIFVTLGSQKFQFNRLVRKIDDLAGEKVITEEIFAQIGYSDYPPKNFLYKDFLGREEFGEQMARSQIVITHGGTGAIIQAVKKRKKVIAVPRLAKFAEHVDDHQIQLLKQFEELNLITSCYNLDQLAEKIEEARNTDFAEYHSNTQTFINNIEKFIEETGR